MVKHHRKKATRQLLVASALAVGMAGAAVAAYNPAHEKIMLKDPAGANITGDAAYSIKTTCFGTAGCHGDAAATGNAVYTYDQIERHSYHAQLGANEFRGFNPANPDSTDAWRAGAGPKGKNWVQSPGHLGSW